MDLFEPGEKQRTSVGCETFPQPLADVLAEMTEGDHHLQRVPSSDALEHFDDPVPGLQTHRMKRAVVVVVRGGTREHDTPAYRADQGAYRLDAGVVARLSNARQALPESLAFGNRQVVVDRVGEPHRQEAERQRGAVDAGIRNSLSAAHGCVLRPAGRVGGILVTAATPRA
jgi:hypothetical protein